MDMCMIWLLCTSVICLLHTSSGHSYTYEDKNHDTERFLSEMETYIGYLGSGVLQVTSFL